jgi:hypothetical protein
LQDAKETQACNSPAVFGAAVQFLRIDMHSEGFSQEAGLMLDSSVSIFMHGLANVQEYSAKPSENAFLPPVDSEVEDGGMKDASTKRSVPKHGEGGITASTLLS